MAELSSVDEILDFAIGKEKEAYQFYTDLAGRMEKPWVREIFKEFAQEELGHKANLLAIKEGKLLAPVEGRVLDLKLADYLIDVEPSPGMDYQQALILAMKAEKAAFKLYTDLAAKTNDVSLRSILLTLAQEEAKHKLKFEIEYDEYISEY